MNLENFVQQALVEIRRAHDGAQRDLERAGLLTPRQVHGDTNTHTSKVEFDVALVASTEGNGTLQVSAGLLGLGGRVEGTERERESITSRVKFTLPLYLPPPVGVVRPADASRPTQ